MNAKQPQDPPQILVHYFRDALSLYEPPTDSTATENGLAYATPGSVGLDLRACFEIGEQEIVLQPGERRRIPVGIALEPVTPNYAAFVYSRSGLGAVYGLVVAQGVGVIDPDYRGEIFVYILNTSHEERRIARGERIAQIVFQIAPQVQLVQKQHLDATTRGTGGFGHTGVR